MTQNIDPDPVRLTVAVAVPLRRLFDYLCDARSPIVARPGMRVEVPFGRQQKIGIIVAVNRQSEDKTLLSENKLKSIVRFVDSAPIIPEQIMALYHWFKKYYHAADGEIWQTLLPNELLRGEPDQIKRQTVWQISMFLLACCAINQLELGNLFFS